jgi:predicted kinase
MGKPLLIIVNGLPGAGKTALARRLAADTQLPVFSRDGIYETLYDALECERNGIPPLLGQAGFILLYSVICSILEAGQSLIVEQFFGNPELRSAEFRRLRQAHDFEPLQILCKADGAVLLERILSRHTVDRHKGHQDLQWIEQNKARLLQGDLMPLDLGGQLIEIDTTTPDSFDYADLLQRVLAVLSSASVDGLI